MTFDCLWRFKLNLRLHLISLPRLICASVRSGPIVIYGPDRLVGLRCFWIGLSSDRSKFILELVRSDSISKIVSPAHWTEPMLSIPGSGRLGYLPTSTFAID